MAPSHRKQPEGQAKPKAKRGASAAVRGGKDDPAGGGSGFPCYFGVDGCGTWNACRAFGRCYGQPPTGHITSFGTLGMEAGSNFGQPIGQGAEAEGGECSPNILKLLTNFESVKELTEQSLRGGDNARCIYWASRLGIVGPDTLSWGWGIHKRWQEQERKAKKRAYYSQGAALLIGLALGLLLSAAYRLVLGS